VQSSKRVCAQADLRATSLPPVGSEALGRAQPLDSRRGRHSPES
jgi:hypothetical protein